MTVQSHLTLRADQLAYCWGKLCAMVLVEAMLYWMLPRQNITDPHQAQLLVWNPNQTNLLTQMLFDVL